MEKTETVNGNELSVLIFHLSLTNMSYDNIIDTFERGSASVVTGTYIFYPK